MDKKSRVYIAGHSGLVGSAIIRSLEKNGFENLICRTREELDLLNQKQVSNFFAEEKIDYTIIAAAKVGGILYNISHQADFLYENLMIAANIVNAAASHGVKKLLYLGSSCIYPRSASQPLKEEYLLSGPLEPTNEAYAIAKIAGLKLCEKYNSQYGKQFFSIMPTNLYGPGDNFHPTNSHVIPGMMRRFHEAKLAGLPEVEIWGTGEPMREFMHVDDLADAILLIMKRYHEPRLLNVGSGIECKISELAAVMKEVTGYEGKIVYDISKPDGTPRKVLDTSRLHSLGWKPKYNLMDGLMDTYRWAISKNVFSLTY